MLLQVLGMKLKAYLPDFHRAFEHFCIHTGGRGVIDGMEKQLNLSRESMQPTRDALYRFGNVSSSSIWCAAALPVSTTLFLRQKTCFLHGRTRHACLSPGQ